MVVVVGGGMVHFSMYSHIFMLIFYIKFQVPSSSGSLVVTNPKRMTDR